MASTRKIHSGGKPKKPTKSKKGRGHCVGGKKTMKKGGKSKK